MGRPWSKLQTSLYNIIDEKSGFQIQCVRYENGGANHRTSARYPRYWITIDKEIIFDFPRMFLDNKALKSWNPNLTIRQVYPYDKSFIDISNLLRQYLDTPKEELLSKEFDDAWGITEILKLVDKRFGKIKFEELIKSNNFKLMINYGFINPVFLDLIYSKRWGK